MARRRVTLEEMHELQLHMLDCIHAYCTENNIRYSLGGGTLLGAIRHKGFIPWDDDVDIMMPRPDYERFLQGFYGNYVHCKLKHWKNDENYPALFARVFDDRTILQLEDFYIGAYIDVFPIDGLPPATGHTLYWNRYRLRRWLERIPRIPYRRMNWKLRLFALATFPVWYFTPLLRLRECSEKFLLKYDFETSECAGCAIGSYEMAEYMDCDTFKEYIDVDFEGRKLKAIKNYAEYLTKHYGNYMQLPPIEKQKTHHKFQCWWKA